MVGNDNCHGKVVVTVGGDWWWATAMVWWSSAVGGDWWWAMLVGDNLESLSNATIKRLISQYIKKKRIVVNISLKYNLYKLEYPKW